MQLNLVSFNIVFCVLTISLPLMAPSSYSQNLAVLYPEVRDPYLQVFLNIAKGAEAISDTNVRLYPLQKQTSPQDLKQWISAHNINVAITLGNRGYTVVPEIPTNVPVVTGAIFLNPNTKGVSGITLAPTPDRLFMFLRRLLPDILNVHVVYLQDKKSWLIEEQAFPAAKNQHVVLHAQSTHSLHELAETYKSVLNSLDPTISALWLPNTGRGLDRALMQQILETAWERKIVVFSSNFSDVKRGVLFSLYPDNFEMGKSLARMAIQRIDNKDAPHRITLVDTLLKAINLRTADHLGLHFTKTQEKNFDFIYPPQ